MVNPGGKLGDSIDVYFDNFENFKKIFSEKAITIFKVVVGVG